MQIDHDERADMINATVANYANAFIGPTRFRAVLHACGLNAAEIQSLYDAHTPDHDRASRVRAQR